MMAQPLLAGAEAVRAGKYGVCLVAVVYTLLGLVLCGTYAWGIIRLDGEFKQSGGAMKLWGRINDKGNEWLLSIYFTSIGLAAIGYLPSLAYAFFIAPELPRGLVNRMCGSLACFFVTELFWMPMCVAYIESPSSLVYTLIRLQLAVSGISGLCWFYFKVFAVPEEVEKTVGAPLRLSAKAGTAIFALHCAILDATVWPPFFHQ
uniref:Uncharacterized protein n=1 Tax=Alexandrium andersonii TaxID=327968 RepID=A0A7S2MKK6_9DINO